MEKKSCLIEHCNSNSYCKGYCRNHYNSLIRHKDPLHAENFMKQRAQRAQEEREKKEHRKQTLGSVPRSRNKGKTCKVPDCTQPAKIKGYCLMHDARIKRNGTLTPKTIYSDIKVEKCLVMSCNGKAHSHGICRHHLNNIKELKTPLKPKVIKLCGVPECQKPHMAQGMCNTHYAQWKAIIQDHSLSKYVKLKGREEDYLGE